MSSKSGILQRVSQRLWQAQGCRIVAGQPTPWTHPELLAEGELHPGLSADEFADRRQRLADALPANGVAVLPAAAQVFMSGAIPYPYRQDPDFWYLTGIQQQAVAVIEAPRHGRPMCFTLFVPKSDPQAERWDGERLNCAAACEVFGADDAFPMTQLGRRLEDILSSVDAVLFDAEAPGRLPLLLPGFLQSWGAAQPLAPTVHRLRWAKSAAELGIMRRGAALTAAGFHAAMRRTRPGVSEHLLAATFECEVKGRGAGRLSYPTIAASGPDACTIHYQRNDKVLRKGDLVLMDAGCEATYASDVTRTWPVLGRFTTPQRALYELVLDVHQRCVAECVPGQTLQGIHNLSVRLITEGLQALGLFPGRTYDGVLREALPAFYPHYVGHWLGLDTHDTRTVGYDQPLAPGAVLTVEPGVYVPNDPLRFGAWAGIGIRIEDDVVVTDAAPEVLSAGVPIAAVEVEQLVRPGG